MENLKYYEMKLYRRESFGLIKSEYIVVSAPRDMDDDDLVDYATDICVTNPYDYVLGVKSISKQEWVRRLPDNRHM